MRKLATGTLIMLAMLALILGGTPRQSGASSHREAPHIISDPLADATDVYAWVSNDRSDAVTLIANYVPLQVPSNGPNYYRFGNDVLYEINIDNDGDAQANITFQFRFRTEVRNQETVAYATGPVTSLDDPDLNVRQFYSVAVMGKAAKNGAVRAGTIIADNLPVAPYNVGPNAFPSGYEPVAMQAVRDIGNGIKVFAGPRDDPFFVDVGGIFDLLKGISGRDALDGLNVHTIAIQVPIVGLKGPKDSVIGVTTTSYRHSDTVLRSKGTVGAKGHESLLRTDPVVQVSRLGMPLVNEAVIPLALKDAFNGLNPAQDATLYTSDTPAGALLRKSVLDPELARELNKALGVRVPPAPRNDLFTIFLTGIPDLNKPATVTPSEQLRLNMSIRPSANPNRMGLLGGDRAGFPNGRRPLDDVTDIEIQAVAGATPFTPGFEANNKLGDGANANDKPFKNTFPYLAEPHDYRGKK